MLVAIWATERRLRSIGDRDKWERVFSLRTRDSDCSGGYLWQGDGTFWPRWWRVARWGSGRQRMRCGAQESPAPSQESVHQTQNQADTENRATTGPANGANNSQPNSFGTDTNGNVTQSGSVIGNTTPDNGSDDTGVNGKGTSTSTLPGVAPGIGDGTPQVGTQNATGGEPLQPGTANSTNGVNASKGRNARDSAAGPNSGANQPGSAAAQSGTAVGTGAATGTGAAVGNSVGGSANMTGTNTAGNSTTNGALPGTNDSTAGTGTATPGTDYGTNPSGTAVPGAAPAQGLLPGGPVWAPAIPHSLPQASLVRAIKAQLETVGPEHLDRPIVQGTARVARPAIHLPAPRQVARVPRLPGALLELVIEGDRSR